MNRRLFDNDEFNQARMALPIKDKAYVEKPRQLYFKKAEGGIVANFDRLPKSFRKFLEKHGDEMLDRFELYRAPLDKLTNNVLQLLTAGDWDNIKKRAGADSLFHTYAIINGKYLYEKTAIPTLREGSSSSISKEGAEKAIAPVFRTSIRDFVGRSILKMKDAYFTYNAFTNNCQDFLINSLQANQMSTPQTTLFLKQDTKKLVEQTPSLSKYLAEKITGFAGAAQHLYEELTNKRGGVRRPDRNVFEQASHTTVKKKFIR
jgi:hypothetical protein